MSRLMRLGRADFKLHQFRSSVERGIALGLVFCSKAPVNRVHELLRDSHPAVKQHVAFHRKLTQLFGDLLVKQLQKAKEIMHSLIYQKTACFGVDMTSRLIALVALAPLRQDLFRNDPTVFEDELGGSETPPSSSGCKWHRTVDVAKRSASGNVPARYQPRQEALLAVKRVLHQKRPLFSTIDFVEGGHQDLGPEEYTKVDEDEFNKDGEQYYHVLKGLLVFEFEFSMDHHVFAFLKDELLVSWRKDMLVMVEQLSDEEVETLRGDNEQAKAALEDVKKQEELVVQAMEMLGEVGDDESVKTTTTSKRSESPRQAAREVKGVLHLRGMDISKISRMPKWNETFWAHARRDVADAFGIDLASVEVAMHGKREIHYCLRLKAEGSELHSKELQMNIAKKLAAGMQMRKCAQQYCKALGIPFNNDVASSAG